MTDLTLITRPTFMNCFRTSCRRLSPLVAAVVLLCTTIFSPRSVLADADTEAASLVQVTLRYKHERKSKDHPVLLIPRIYGISAGDKLAYGDRLPSVVEKPSVSFYLAPNGQALRQYYGRAATDPPPNPAVLAKQRIAETGVWLYYVPKDQPWESRVRKLRGDAIAVGLYDGLEHFREGNWDVFLGAAGTDRFEIIRCLNNPVPRCDAEMRIDRNIGARVGFMDFRLHGGRDFANARLRMVHETVCRFVVPACEVK
jgi:hypothetical protein